MWKDGKFLFKEAFEESLKGVRKGDKPEETQTLRKLLSGGRFGVVTDNDRKFTVFKSVLAMFGINDVVQIRVPTGVFDLQQIPSLSKALSGRNFKECDFYIARGRLGLPGSGAFTVIIDVYGNVLSAVTSPPHHLHGFSLETAVFFDAFRLFRRLGLTPSHRGITDRTRTVYSSFTIMDVARKIAFKKAEMLKIFRGDTLLVIGGYLDGIFIADHLKDNFRKVFLYDKEKEVMLLSPFDRPDEGAGFDFDVIIDLTGFGGVEVREKRAGKFRGKIVVSEEPSGVEFLETGKKPDFFLRMVSGGKTSGTMTLTVSAVREVSIRIEKCEGVLYAVPNLFFAESLLFNVKSSRSFLDLVEIPAVTASVRKGADFGTHLFDSVLDEILGEIRFELAEL